MAEYTATAISEGDHWEVDVEGVGATQADNLDDVEGAAVGLITARTHIAAQDVRVQVRII